MSTTDVHTRGPGCSFRYLGFHIGIDSDPSLAARAVSFEVWKICTDIRTRRLDLIQVGHLLREYLYPRIELNLVYTRFSEERLMRWDRLIRSAALHWGHDAATRSVNSRGFFLTVGVLPLQQYSAVVRTNSLGVMLRSAPAPSAATSDARLRTAIARGRVRVTVERPHVRLWPVRAPAYCRASHALKLAAELGHYLSYRAPTALVSRSVAGVLCPILGCTLLPNPAEDRTLEGFCGDDYEGLGLVAFTDGSYFVDHDQGESRCGYAAVLIRKEDYLDPTYTFTEGTYFVLRGAAPLAGANYAAEVKALLAVLHSVPVKMPVLCVSDALSALQVLWKPVLANGARMRMGARSLGSAARALLARRSLHTTTDRVHIHSHSGGKSVNAMGNAVADRDAQLAATQCAPCGPALAAEGEYVFWESRGGGYFHVHGDLRKSLVKRATALCAGRWRGLPSQGRTLRDFGSESVLALARLTRKTRDAPLLTFCLKATTLQLSTSDRTRYRAERRLVGRWACRRCGVNMPTCEREEHLKSSGHLDTPSPPIAPIAPCPMCCAPQRFMHPFVCPSSLPSVEAAASFARALFRDLCEAVIRQDPPAIKPEHHHTILGLPDRFPFFRFPLCATPEEDREFFQHYGRALGLTQGLLQEFVCTDYLTSDEAAVKALRKSLPLSLERLSVTVLRETKAIHNLWWLRTRERAPDASGVSIGNCRAASCERGLDDQPASKKAKRSGAPGLPPRSTLSLHPVATAQCPGEAKPTPQRPQRSRKRRRIPAGSYWKVARLAGLLPAPKDTRPPTPPHPRGVASQSHDRARSARPTGSRSPP
jgi:hypothetical protein